MSKSHKHRWVLPNPQKVMRVSPDLDGYDVRLWCPGCNRFISINITDIDVCALVRDGCNGRDHLGSRVFFLKTERAPSYKAPILDMLPDDTPLPPRPHVEELAYLKARVNQLNAECSAHIAVRNCMSKLAAVRRARIQELEDQLEKLEKSKAR